MTRRWRPEWIESDSWCTHSCKWMCLLPNWITGRTCCPSLRDTHQPQVCSMSLSWTHEPGGCEIVCALALNVKTHHSRWHLAERFFMTGACYAVQTASSFRFSRDKAASHRWSGEHKVLKSKKGGYLRIRRWLLFHQLKALPRCNFSLNWIHCNYGRMRWLSKLETRLCEVMFEQNVSTKVCLFKKP